MPSKQRAVIASAWKGYLMSLLTFHHPCRHTTLLTPKSGKTGTNWSSARRYLSNAIRLCAAHSSWLAHDFSTARIGWTARPQSVPSRMSGKERDEFPD